MAEEVDDVMAIFSRAVADSESKWRFCKSSEFGFKSIAGLLSAHEVLDMFCLILDKVNSSAEPVAANVGEPGMLTVGVVVVALGHIFFSAVCIPFVVLGDRSKISCPDSREGKRNCLRLLVGFSTGPLLFFRVVAALGLGNVVDSLFLLLCPGGDGEVVVLLKLDLAFICAEEEDTAADE